MRRLPEYTLPLVTCIVTTLVSAALLGLTLHYRRVQSSEIASIAKQHAKTVAAAYFKEESKKYLTQIRELESYLSDAEASFRIRSGLPISEHDAACVFSAGERDAILERIIPEYRTLKRGAEVKTKEEHRARWELRTAKSTGQQQILLLSRHNLALEGSPYICHTYLDNSSSKAVEPVTSVAFFGASATILDHANRTATQLFRGDGLLRDSEWTINRLFDNTSTADVFVPVPYVELYRQFSTDDLVLLNR